MGAKGISIHLLSEGWQSLGLSSTQCSLTMMGLVPPHSILRPMAFGGQGRQSVTSSHTQPRPLLPS